MGRGKSQSNSAQSQFDLIGYFLCGIGKKEGKEIYPIKRRGPAKGGFAGFRYEKLFYVEKAFALYDL